MPEFLQTSIRPINTSAIYWAATNHMYLPYLRLSILILVLYEITITRLDFMSEVTSTDDILQTIFQTPKIFS